MVPCPPDNIVPSAQLLGRPPVSEEVSGAVTMILPPDHTAVHLWLYLITKCQLEPDIEEPTGGCGLLWEDMPNNRARHFDVLGELLTLQPL